MDRRSYSSFFDLPFIIETDASSYGIRAVLMLDGHPISFISKALSASHRTLSTYERELLAIIFVVKKWQQYLMDKHVIIRTDQQSLKHLLDNRIATHFQQKWLSKLMGLDFEIIYKQGTENKAADALTRVGHGELLQLVLSHGTSDLYDSIKHSWQTDVELSQLIQSIEQDPASHPKYSWQSQELRRKGKLVIGNCQDLKAKILTLWCAGHYSKGVKIVLLDKDEERYC